MDLRIFIPQNWMNVTLRMANRPSPYHASCITDPWEKREHLIWEGQRWDEDRHIRTRAFLKWSSTEYSELSSAFVIFDTHHNLVFLALSMFLSAMNAVREGSLSPLQYPLSQMSLAEIFFPGFNVISTSAKQLLADDSNSTHLLFVCGALLIFIQYTSSYIKDIVRTYFSSCFSPRNGAYLTVDSFDNPRLILWRSVRYGYWLDFSTAICQQCQVLNRSCEVGACSIAKGSFNGYVQMRRYSGIYNKV